jgi:DNA helicase IV
LPRKRTVAHGNPDEDNPYVVDGRDIFTGEAVGRDVPDEISEVTTYADRMAAGRGARRPRDEDEDEPVEYAHIVIDEAQDLTPMQWRMLGRRGMHATWTIVEDPAQSAWEDPAASARAMAEALRERRRYEFELTTNYRNPVEVADVAARVLVRAVPGARPARAVRSGGERPVVRATSGERIGPVVRKLLRELLASVEGTVGVITPVGAAGSLAEDLAGLDARVQLMDALDAKGLEFDAAIIVDPREIVNQSPNGMRTLYVALTRATRTLTIVTPDPDWTTDLLGITPT